MKINPAATVAVVAARVDSVVEMKIKSLSLFVCELPFWFSNSHYSI